MNMKRYFITGCNVAINLPDGAPVAAGLKAATDEQCPTAAVRKARSVPQAKEICKRCPAAQVQPYLEKAPDLGDTAPQTAPPTQTPREAVSEEPVLVFNSGPVAAGGLGWDPEEPVVEAPQAEPPAHSPPSPAPAPSAEEHGLGWDPDDDAAALGAQVARDLQDVVGPAKPSPAPEEPEEPPPDVPEGAFDLRGREAWGTGRAKPQPPEEGNPSLHQLLVGADGGPSLFGTSKIRAARSCLRRFFWTWLCGWRTRRVPELEVGDKVHLDPLALGILVHYMMECYLNAGFSLDEAVKALDKVKPYYPRLAAEAARLVQRYYDEFARLDTETWDVLAVEQEVRYYYPARQCGGAKRSLCVTARVDSLIHPLRPGVARLTPGQTAANLRVHDLKTIANVTASAKAAYRHDPQILQGLLCVNYGYWIAQGAKVPGGLVAERWGTAEGAVITWIGKAKESYDPQKHTGRLAYTVGAPLIEEYRDTLGDWLYDELGPRLFGKHVLKAETWPKGYDCRDPRTNTVCPYVEICEGQERGDPAKDPEAWEKHMPLEPSDMLQLKVKRSGKVAAVAQAKDK